MAKMRRLDSKAALGQQRAQLRRGARGKVHIGDDAGSSAGRAAELAKVHRMQEHAREEAHRLEENHLAYRAHEEADERTYQEPPHVTEEERPAPIAALLVELVTDSLRLARTFVMLPFRVAAALRGHHPRASEA